MSAEPMMSPPPPNQMGVMQPPSMMQPPSTMQPPSRQPSMGPVRIEETLSASFPAFESDQVLVSPYHDELRRDAEFQAHLHQMLLALILKFHAWSTCRPEYESEVAGDALYAETQLVQSTEKEQGRFPFSFEFKRVRLLEFVTRIKSALAALTGLSL